MISLTLYYWKMLSYKDFKKNQVHEKFRINCLQKHWFLCVVKDPNSLYVIELSMKFHGHTYLID